MPKIEITRTELVWPGKYDEDGNLAQVERVNLPFQVIETVNETRATREAKKAPQLNFFDYWEPQEGDTFEEGWKNKLIWGDNKYVMSSLLAQGLAGKIDLIYIDPPFATGADFSFRTQIGDEDVVKEQSIIEEKAYRDTWGRGVSSYLQMMYERLILMRDLLSDKGSIYIHLAHHVGQYMKVILDEIFGADCFQNEIIWFYKTGGATKQRFARKHDNIFFYSKSPDDWVFVPQRERSYMMHKYGFKKSNFQIDEETGLQYSMVYARDVWEIPSVGSATFERVGFDTQKPEALLDRIIKASSNEGDLVADFFYGSGTTLSVAEKLDRRWIGCDLGRFAIHTARKRLMDIEGCRPFEILNLGKYERQVWQGVSFGKGKSKDTQQMLIFEYLKFILKLYGAEPLAGMEHLHGKKGNAVVHVGAVDAPVTIDEVLHCLDECQAAKQKELHVLGWEWEMGLNGLMTGEAKTRGIKLLMLHIPREVMEPQAVEKGDIRFFELAYLEAEIKPSRRKRSYTVTLTDFVIPNTELIREEVRQKVRKWSDYVDYWAVDWEFQNDTFINQWTSYRTRRDRSLQLKTDPHIYDEPGTYNILVKVIDIFGIDTSQLFTMEVT